MEDRILTLAAALGRAIQEDERYLELKAARENNDADEKLQDAIGRFNLAKFNLNSEVMREERDSDRVTALNEEVQNVYEEIMTAESMVRYQAAKAPVDMLCERIDSIVRAAVNGLDPEQAAEEPSGCAGDCSSCHGCH